MLAAGENMSDVRLNDLQFAVLDFETTGLFPQLYDRVIEVGTVRMDAQGNVLDRYTTLVQPNRDLGLSGLHGIRGRDLEAAPTFDAIAGDVLDRVGGAVLVGHNVRFDAGFLTAECGRLGLALPAVASLCTLRLGYHLEMAPPRRNLIEACGYFGIELDHPHSALDDALAASQLLAMYLREAEAKGLRYLSELGCTTEVAPRDRWPRRGASAAPLPRAEAARRPSSAATYLARLMARLPAARASDEANLVPYLELLDRALEDRRLTQDEVHGLEEVAVAWGLTAEDAQRAHRSYLDGLAAAANADGRVTDTEQRDLDDAAALLGFPKEDVVSALQRTARVGGPPAQAAERPSLAGLSVCFTGALQCRVAGEVVTRAHAERLATEAGLTVRSSVSKKLDLLVVADPETLSGKAKKARELGTRVMADAVFFRGIGVGTE